MPGREFFLWQVRSFTVRVDLELVDNLNQLLADPRHKIGDELGGILLGRFISPNEIEVSNFEFVRSDHHRGAIYGLGLREQFNFAKRVAGLNRNRRIKPVGFFRTHHRPGLFLDQDDFSLMSDAFSDPSQIALLIRPLDPGPSNAGIFIWENGDIDRRQTQLLFPFDAGTLRLQGPIESTVKPEIPKPEAPKPVPIPIAVPEPVVSPVARNRIPLLPVRWVVWGAAAGVGALALSAALPHYLHVKATTQVPLPRTVRIAKAVRTAPPAVPPASPIETALPAATEPSTQPLTLSIAEPKPDEGQPDVTPPKRFIAPAVMVQRQEPRQIAVVAPPPLALPRVEAVALAALPEPELPAPVHRLQPHPEPRPVPVHRPAVHVAVNIEPKESPELIRVVSHVPLLGYPLHAEGGSDFSAARPNASLAPKVPEELALNLSGKVAVDVRLSIDKNGLVTNTEVLHGAGTQFAALAASNAGAVSWEPAYQGKHRVSSDVVVHYLFTPASEAQQ